MKYPFFVNYISKDELLNKNDRYFCLKELCKRKNFLSEIEEGFIKIIKEIKELFFDQPDVLNKELARIYITFSAMVYLRIDEKQPDFADIINVAVSNFVNDVKEQYSKMKIKEITFSQFFQFKSLCLEDFDLPKDKRRKNQLKKLVKVVGEETSTILLNKVNDKLKCRESNFEHDLVDCLYVIYLVVKEQNLKKVKFCEKELLIFYLLLFECSPDIFDFVISSGHFVKLNSLVINGYLLFKGKRYGLDSIMNKFEMTSKEEMLFKIAVSALISIEFYETKHFKEAIENQFLNLEYIFNILRDFISQKTKPIYSFLKINELCSMENIEKFISMTKLGLISLKQQVANYK